MALKSSDCNDWPPLSDEEVTGFMPSIPMWERKEYGSDGLVKLVRSFTCKNFQVCLDFIQAAGAVAEARGHHPDFHLTGYRNMDVVIFSHSLKAITENDINLCRALDEIKVAYSPKWLKDHPTAADSALEE